MRKWTMLLALLLATVFCFPGALAEQEAVESTGDNGGGQLVSHVYEPGDIASGLLAQAFGQEHGAMIVAEVRGEGIPLEAEMPDLVLRLGAGLQQQGARLELGLRESQENVGFDIVLDADAQGLAIASDLLPDERYTMNWETLLGMNLEEMTAGLLGTLEMQTAQTAAAISALEPLMEPYVAIVDEFMQELAVKEFYDVPEEYGFPAVAYEIYITCTHAQAAELLTRLADQLEGDGQLAPVLDVMLASQGLGSAAIVELMRGAAGPLAQSEGHFVLGAGTNYDAAAEPWYVVVTNTQEDGATDEWYLSFEPYAEENTPYFFDLGYSQTLADGSLGDGMRLILGILSMPDTALTGWTVELTVSEGETDTGLLRISALKRPTTTEEGLPGYGGEVYIGVGNPEIVMEYEHEMNAFMTPDGGEAFTLEGTLCPDAAQSADTYAFTLEAGVEPGPDGLQGRGRLMIGTEDMPELTGLSFELHEAEPLQLGGTDVALESADVVLMRSTLMDAVGAYELSRATLRNIHENLFWAFIYNIIGIPLAAGVFIPLLGWQLNPMFGAAAMSLSSFCVVSNALRLNLFDPHSARKDHKIKFAKEPKTMQKTLKIEGMMCTHCSGRVKKALEELPGVVSAEVSHENGTAVVTMSAPVDDATLKKAVEDQGYQVVG